MAEKNQSEQWALRNKTNDARISLHLRGQLLSFVAAIIAMLTGAVLIALGSTIIGSVITAGSLLGAVGLYIRGEFWHRGNSGKGQE